MKRKLISGCLMLALAVTILTPVSKVQAANVLKISTTRELDEFAKRVSSGTNYKGYTVKLMNDLQYDGTVNNFEPIGSSIFEEFSGIFDGGNHTISGIDCTGSGLFGRIDAGAVVKNLTLENCSFTTDSADDSGSIAARIGDNGQKGTIDNCHVIGGEVINTAPKSDAGGLIGEGAGDIRNCSNSASVTADFYAGGIIGELNGKFSTLSNSYNLGTINSKQKENSPSAFGAGGLIGNLADVWNNISILNCYSAGTAQAGLIYHSNWGGTVGNCYYMEDSATISIQESGSIREKNNSVYSASYMQSDEFLKTLNSNAASKDTWMAWKFADGSDYPVLKQAKSSPKLKARVGTKTYKASVLSKKTASFRISAKAKNSIGYKVITGKKYISVSSDGKVKIKKKTPKGTYKIQVFTTENAKYKKATLNITIKVK